MTWVHLAVLAALAFAFGASVGSFLNVCVWRLPRGESVLRPRSHCPSCHTPIASRDNVPVLAWLRLRGRCRSCAWPIPARYPLVEGAVGLLFALVVLADVVLGPADPTERGLVSAAGRLLYHLGLVSVFVTVTMIARDERRGVTPRPSGRPSPGRVALAALTVLAALGGVLAGDPLGSALNAGLLAVLVLRLVPARTRVVY